MYRALVTLLSQYYVAVSLVLLAIISTLSLLPLPELPEVPGGDKLHHLIAYLCLAVPVSLKGGKWMLIVLVIFVLWGGCIELIQPYVNRYGEWLDFWVNTLGVVFGAGIGVASRLLLNLKNE